MSENTTKRYNSKELDKLESKTDWERLERMQDEEIDVSEVPELDEAFWQHARQFIYTPQAKKQVTMRIDADVLDWFREQGKGYQTMMNGVLKAYKETVTAEDRQDS